MVGPLLEELFRTVGHEDSDPARAAVDESGLDRSPEIVLSGHVLDCVVDEHGVETASEPRRTHVATPMVTLGVQLARDVEHLL